MIEFRISADLLSVMMGRFVEAGTIFGGVYTDRQVAKSKTFLDRRKNHGSCSVPVRSGHRGAVVWFTGLSGAGKSTIAQAL